MPTGITIHSTAIQLHDLALPNRLIVDEIAIQGENISLETDPLSIHTQTEADIVASLSENRLASFLETLLPSAVRQIEVQLVGGRVQVAVIAKIVFEMKVIALCTLEIVGESEIFVRLQSVNPGGPVASLIESQIDRINPVFSSSELPFPIRIIRSEIESGMLKVYGKLNLE